MKKYLFAAVLLLCAADSWALTVGQVMAPIQQNQQPQREMAIQYWSGGLDMAVLINKELTQSGKPLFCLPDPAPSLQQLFDFFTQDVEAQVKAQGLDKVAVMNAPEITLRSLTARYGKCK